MQLRSLTVTLVAALLVVGAGTGGALAATDSLHAQQSPTNTTDAGTATSGAGGTDTTSGTGDTAAATSGPSVTFNDQNSSGESVFIQSATLPQSGFVAIYDSSRSGNRTNQVIGASYPLSAGTSNNIRIQLDEPLNQTKSLTAVVHTDSNSNDNFDFVASNGQQDPPLTQGDRRIVDIAQVTVEGASGNADTATAATTSGDSAATDTGGEATDAGGAGGTTANAGGNESGGTNGSGNGSSSSGPGFGLAVAVVALLAAALLATRRN